MSKTIDVNDPARDQRKKDITDGYNRSGQQLDSFTTLILPVLTAGSGILLSQHQNPYLLLVIVVGGLLTLLVHYISYITSYDCWTKFYKSLNAASDVDESKYSRSAYSIGRITILLNRIVWTAMCAIFVSSIIAVVIYR